jgi:hypothetical protein
MTYGALHYQQAFELIFGKAVDAAEAVAEPLLPAETVEPAEPATPAADAATPQA